MEDPLSDQELTYLQDDIKRKQVKSPPPKKLDYLISNLMARRGYAQTRAAEALDQAWSAAAGKHLANASRVGKLRGGTLTVIAENSTVMQELTFQKRRLVKKLSATDGRIIDLRFQVGPLT